MPDPIKDLKPSETIGRFKKELQDTQAEQQVQERQHVRELKRKARHEKWDAEGAEKWEKFVRNTTEMIETGQRGYDTWISAMMAIATNCALLAQGLSAYKYSNRAIEFVVNPVLDFVRDDEPFFKPIEIPDLVYRVAFTDDNKLDIPSLTKNIIRSDGLKCNPEELKVLQYSMHEGVKEWLKDLGYKVKNGTTIGDEFEDANQVQLTKVQFEALLNDPNKGLDQFLTSRLNMNMEHEHGMRPGG